MKLNYVINKPVQDVFHCLSSMPQFMEVHPVVYRIVETGAGEYRFFEKIKVLFIPFDFSYAVRVEREEHNGVVNMYSTVQKGVDLHLSFRLKSMDGQTVIEESIHIESPVVVKQVFQFILRKTHRKLFRNIAEKASAHKVTII